MGWVTIDKKQVFILYSNYPVIEKSNAILSRPMNRGKNVNISPESNPDDFLKKALEEFHLVNRVDSEEEFHQRVFEKESEAKERKKTISRLVTCCIIFVCLGIVIFQLPKLRSAVTHIPQPNRIGGFNTDVITDQCIHNLWKIVKQHQLEDTWGEGFSCPATGIAYEIEQTHSSFTVKCPNPEAHGFSSVQVSSDKMIPELIK